MGIITQETKAINLNFLVPRRLFFFHSEATFLQFESMPATVLLSTIVTETVLKVNHYDRKIALQE